MFDLRPGAPSSRAAPERRAALLGSASIEISARDARSVPALSDVLAQGTRVHVTFLPNVSYATTIATARALAREGFVPVPHIAARNLASRDELADYVARLASEAGVRRVLLVGGDMDSPRGPFSDCLSVLRTEEFQRVGITAVAFAGHPEGHPKVPDDVMTSALAAKLAFARKSGLTADVITQLCFEAQPIVAWINRLRRAGIAEPIAIGTAAPTNALLLVKFALRCGVGPSIRALTSQPARVGRLLAHVNPEPLLAELATALGPDAGDITAMHYFVFGSAANAAAWLSSLQASARMIS